MTNSFVPEDDTVDAMLAAAEFTAVKGWVRPVLILWPHADALIDTLLRMECRITVVIPEYVEYIRMRDTLKWKIWQKSTKLQLVYAEHSAYLAGCTPQTFMAVFASDVTNESRILCRRVLAWNGKLHTTTCPPASSDYSEARLSITNKDVDSKYTLYSMIKPIGWLIMSYPRCGTHMLATALNNHPDLRCYGEVFNPTTSYGKHNFATVQQVFEVGWPDKHTGFAVHSLIDRPGCPATMLPDMAGYSSFWEHIPDYTPTIFIQRKNALARYVSHIMAISTGVWNSTGTDGTPEDIYAPVHVDIREFEYDMKYSQECYDSAAMYFKYGIRVYYEDMLNDWDTVMETVQTYLHVPYVPVKPDTIKLALPLRETIDNYIQVEAWCKRKGYAHFLEGV